MKIFLEARSEVSYIELVTPMSRRPAYAQEKFFAR